MLTVIIIYIRVNFLESDCPCFWYYLLRVTQRQNLCLPLRSNAAIPK